MRFTAAICSIFIVAALLTYSANSSTLLGQDKVAKKTAEETKKTTDEPKKAADQPPSVLKKTDEKDAPKKTPVEEKFDQKKADIETIRTAGLAVDAKALLDFFQKHTVTDADRARLGTLINQLGDDDFDKREQATDEITRFGVAAIGLLRQAERTKDPEVLRRCELCLKNIEKVPTRTLAAAAARLLADMKPVGATETLLKYLPLAEDDTVGDEVRAALAANAMKGGKPDAVLSKTLEEKDALKRDAAAEAFARGGDKAMRDEMRKLLLKDGEGADLRLRVALAMVNYAKDKSAVEQLIKVLPDVPMESSWRAEELLIRMAGEKGPNVSMGVEKSSREKGRDEWMKWWKANEKDIDLAKLDESERMLGYTLLIEMDIRGIGGRVLEISPDGKKRWEITNVQFPTDAVVVPGNHVVIAEQNTNRVSERDVTNGKEIWAETFQQPIGLQRLVGGNLVVVGRHQIVEWDRARKAVATVTRPQYDIVAGAKMRNGQFAVYTQQGQLVTYDKDGKQLATFNAGRGNYNSTMQVLPNGKLLVTQFRSVGEVDVAKKEFVSVLTYNYATSAQRLPNGNILVGNQNNYQIAEMDPKSNKSVWDYKPVDNNNFYRAWRAKRR